MNRTASRSGRKPFLLLVLAAIGIGSAWWWHHSPPEPAVRGVRFSEYFIHKPERDARPYDEQVREFGPAGVAWLTYKLEHGRYPFRHDKPLPLDDAPDWVRRWFPEQWGGLLGSTEIHERMEAADLLACFGPQAAPAIPALGRSLESEDGELAYHAAYALFCIGPPSWTAIRNVLDHGSRQARINLFERMYEYFGPGGKDADPGIEVQLPSAVESYIKAFRDPDPKVRAKAAYSLGDCVHLRDDDDPCFNAALPVLIELLSDRDADVVEEAARTVGLFRSRAVVAIPRLIETLNDINPPVRSRAVWALMLIDAPEHSLPRLRAMLQDPDADCRQTASEGPRFLDYTRAAEGAKGEDSPGR